MNGRSSRASSAEPFDNEGEEEVRSWQASLLKTSSLSRPLVTFRLTIQNKRYRNRLQAKTSLIGSLTGIRGITTLKNFPVTIGRCCVANVS
jgi:hypothetical protein